MAHRLQRLHDGCGNLWESSKGLSKKRKIANSAHTFAEGLLHHGKGFPLWSPNPIDAVVCVADVGIINERGRFEIFFNILLSRPQHGFDEQSPGVYSLPEGFPPFEFEPLSGETPVHVDPLPENKLFMDRSRREFGASMDASSGGLGVLGGGFSFSTERSSGAALFTSHSITYDLNRKYETKLKNHLIKYSSWWENYVSQEHEGLRLSDIVIVTGCYNTRNWAVAAFDNSRSSARIKFQVQDEIGLSVWGSWEATQSIDTKAGPDRRCETPSRRPVPWIEPSQYADCDQNVFLKGLRFTTRSSFFSLRLKAGAGPHLLPRDHNDSEGEPSLTIANFPSLDKGHSLHDELMEHYFMKTEADIVIIDHDEMAIASAILNRHQLSSGPEQAYFRHFMHPKWVIVHGKKIISREGEPQIETLMGEMSRQMWLVIPACFILLSFLFLCMYTILRDAAISSSSRTFSYVAGVVLMIPFAVALHASCSQSDKQRPEKGSWDKDPYGDRREQGPNPQFSPKGSQVAQA